MELFDRKYVYLEWDDVLEGKEGAYFTLWCPRGKRTPPRALETIPGVLSPF